MNNWDTSVTYAPYIPFHYWEPSAGWDKVKGKKKLQLKLDDELFEL